MICLLPTTIDNPYDPFDQFDDWLKYDMERGYGTSEMLARIAVTSDDYTEEQNQKAAAWLEQTLAKNAPDATTARLQEIGELDEWFRCNGNTPYVVHPLRVEE